MNVRPSAGAYQDALQTPEVAFTDPLLAAGEVTTDALGLPKAVAGAFAVVFRVATPGEAWAVRLFTGDAAGQADRYAALARHLAAHPVPEVVPFDFQPEGVRVEGRAYPLVRMPWVPGPTLDRFVATHLDRPDVLSALAAAWAALAARLDTAGFVHGDLQHGNVLVRMEDGAPRLALVDLDAAVVPGVPRGAPAEAGHRNYAHPDRPPGPADAAADRFAALVVYVALAALARRPDLWAVHHTGENLLFTAADLAEPGTSPLFAALAADVALRPLAEHLARAALLPPRALGPLADLLAGRTTLPEPSGPVRRGERRTAFERAFAPVVAAALVLAGAIGALFGWQIAAVPSAAVLAFAAGAVLAYRARHPLARHRRRLAAEDARYAAEGRRLAAVLARNAAERTRLDDHAADAEAGRLRAVQAEALHDRLKHHFVGEAEADAGVGHKAIVRLKGAGVRTAVHVTPDRLESVPEIGPETRARLLDWRRSLDARYAPVVPAELPEGERRRLALQRDHRLRDLDREAGRLRERQAALAAERTALAERTAAVPAIGVGRAIAVLFRLRPVPRLSDAPRPAPPGARNAAVAARTEGPWWADAAGP